MPWAVLDSAAWQSCSPPARALLLELARQHNGRNNGHLHLARAWLAGRGWRRPATVRKLREELIRNRLIVKTRDGGLNNGSHLFAVTWHGISDFTGLDMSPKDYQRGGHLLPPLPAEHSRETKNSRTAYVLEKASAGNTVCP